MIINVAHGFRRLGLPASLVALSISPVLAAPSINITSPSPGSIAAPGQIVIVTVEPGTGTTLRQVTAGIAPLNQIPQVTQSPPYQIPVQVPSGRVGTVSVNALALDTSGNTLQASVNIVVKAASSARAIQVNPDRLVYSQVNGQVRSLSVIASFQDGTTAYITNAPDVQYASSNEKVVVVSSGGQAVATGLGNAGIAVTYGGLTVNVPVSVGVYPLRGDLNGDGAVDKNDLQLLLAGLNTTSNGPGDPRDLNSDGVVNALDARILVTLCSQAACATH